MSDRSSPNRGLNAVLPDGLLGLDTNDTWRFHRRLISPLFTERYLKIYATVIEEEVGKMVKIFDKKVIGNSFVTDIHDDLTRLTLDVIGLESFRLTCQEGQLLAMNSTRNKRNKVTNI